MSIHSFNSGSTMKLSGKVSARNCFLFLFSESLKLCFIQLYMCVIILWLIWSNTYFVSKWRIRQESMVIFLLLAKYKTTYMQNETVSWFRKHEKINCGKIRSAVFTLRRYLRTNCLDRKKKWSKSVYKTDIAGVYDWREPGTADNESWEPSSVCSHLQVGYVKLSLTRILFVYRYV